MKTFLYSLKIRNLVHFIKKSKDFLYPLRNRTSALFIKNLFFLYFPKGKFPRKFLYLSLKQESLKDFYIY